MAIVLNQSLSRMSVCKLQTMFRCFSTNMSNQLCLSFISMKNFKICLFLNVPWWAVRKRRHLDMEKWYGTFKKKKFFYRMFSDTCTLTLTEWVSAPRGEPLKGVNHRTSAWVTLSAWAGISIVTQAQMSIRLTNRSSPSRCLVFTH